MQTCHDCGKAAHSIYPDSPVSVPTYDRFIEPLLRFLASRPEGATAREAHEAAAAALALSEADKQEMLPSGNQTVYKNRAGWAYDRLKRAGLSSSPRRGYWKLTEAGSAYAASHTAPLSPQDVEQLAVGFMDVRLRATGDATPLASIDLPLPSPPSSAVSQPRRQARRGNHRTASLGCCGAPRRAFKGVTCFL